MKRYVATVTVLLHRQENDDELQTLANILLDALTSSSVRVAELRLQTEEPS